MFFKYCITIVVTPPAEHTEHAMSSFLDGKNLTVIGDPIEHSLSPLIQQAMLDELGIPCIYGRIFVPAGTVKTWLPSTLAMNLAGFNATMPHKTDLVPLMDTLSDDARMYRAVNTVVIRDGRFHGHNTDGAGFVRSLHDEGIYPTGKNITVYGAGGAARSVVLKLAAEGAKSIAVCCRTPSKAEELARASHNVHVAAIGSSEFERALAETELFINCTPLGMQGVPSQFSSFDFLDILPKSAPVCDLIYKPLKTKLLEEAGKRGHQTMNGLGMLIHQAILALEQFASMPLDAALMMTAVQKKLVPVLEKSL